MKTLEKNIPFSATHPGTLLKDELVAGGIKQKEFAVEIGMQHTMLSEIINGKRPITADLAILLERSLGISADYWLRFQSQYDIDISRIKERNIQKLFNIDIWKIIKEYVPVNYFRKLGYLVDDLNVDIAKIKEVYNINNVDDLIVLSAKQKFSFFRKSDKLKISEKNILAWNVLAKYKANQQIVNKFYPEKIPNLVEELKTIFFQNSDAVNQVEKALKKYGIKFILVPKLEQTPIDGYTFWSGNNPVIALTIRHQRIDNFAFTIMHEIGHIELHLKDDKEQQFFDLKIKSPHLEVIEEEADKFATENLIPRHIWLQFKTEKNITERAIIDYAGKYNIHPAIILGRINYESKFYAIKTSIDKKLY
ncbi:MAG: HigA family addiction module antitoxin [Lutibacter sp.]|nr:HigA family addiction module antitoxin [Lutibacter sp.]